MIKKILSLLLLFTFLSSVCLANWGHQKPPLGVQVDWSNPITKGLVGCWLFNEAGGDKVYDLSGNNNTGTLTNMAFPSTTSSGWNPGKDGSAIAFDKSNDYIDTNTDELFQLTDGTIITSVFANSYPAADADQLRAIVTKDQSGWHDDLIFSLGSDEVVDLTHLSVTIQKASNTTRYTATDTVTFPLNTPQMVATTWGKSTLKLYREGKLAASNAFTGGVVSSGRNVLFGQMQGVAGRFWDGWISYVYIFNRALSPQEIQQLYIEPYGMFKKERVSLWESTIGVVARRIMQIF